MTIDLVKQPIKMSLILAMANNRGIGIKGRLPWRIPKDLKFYTKVVTFTKDPMKKNAVIMGKYTWFSIPKGLRPLPNRINVIVSSTLTRDQLDANENLDLDDVIICKTYDEAVHTIVEKYADQVEHIFAMGGTQIYKESLNYPYGFLHRIYLTRVFMEPECDAFMEPENFLDSFDKLTDVPEEDKKNYNVEFNTVQTEPSNNIEYCFEIYEKRPPN